jgi:single-strand DNA-binding protein
VLGGVQKELRDMVSINRITIIGNLGNEPEMRFTPSGRPVTSFRVATNWRYTTPEGERKEETEWFSVVAWGRLAEQCNQFLTKGRLVYVEGRLRLRTWDGQDGQRRARNEIVADRVKFLDRQAAIIAAENKTDESETGEIEPDDIPF